MDREAWQATVHGVKKGWTWLSDKAQNNIYVKILPLLFFLFSHTVMSNSLQPHGLQHARPLCPSPSPRVCPSSCSLHRWCCSAISSYDTLFSFCSQYPSAFITTYLYFFNSFFYVSLPLILLPKIHPPHSYPPFSSQPFNVRGIRDQIDNICWIIGKAREFQKEKKKKIYFCFTDYTKALDCVDHNCGKFLKTQEYQTTLPASWATVCRARGSS